MPDTKPFPASFIESTSPTSDAFALTDAGKVKIKNLSNISSWNRTDLSQFGSPINAYGLTNFAASVVTTAGAPGGKALQLSADSALPGGIGILPFASPVPLQDMTIDFSAFPGVVTPGDEWGIGLIFAASGPCAMFLFDYIDASGVTKWSFRKGQGGALFSIWDIALTTPGVTQLKIVGQKVPGSPPALELIAHHLDFVNGEEPGYANTPYMEALESFGSAWNAQACNVAGLFLHSPNGAVDSVAATVGRFDVRRGA